MEFIAEECDTLRSRGCPAAPEVRATLVRAVLAAPRVPHTTRVPFAVPAAPYCAHAAHAAAGPGRATLSSACVARCEFESNCARAHATI